MFNNRKRETFEEILEENNFLGRKLQAKYFIQSEKIKYSGNCMYNILMCRFMWIYLPEIPFSFNFSIMLILITLQLQFTTIAIR